MVVVRRVALVSILATLGTIPMAAQEGMEVLLATQLEVESLLLEQAIDEYFTATSQQGRARQRAADAAERFDAALRSGSEPASELMRLADAVRQTEATATAAEAGSRDRRQVVFDHLRRVELLRTVSEATAETRQAADPITGLWSVTVLPFDQRGVFDLELDGTLIRGSYALDGGYTGSFRGTFVGNRVRLERIDSTQGFDVVYEAEYDPARQRLSGGWTNTLLNSPGPSGGEWTATKIQRSAESP